MFPKDDLDKVENFLKGSLDSIASTSHYGRESLLEV